MKVELRPASADDETFLAELDADVQSAELAPAGLPPAALAQLLAMQHRARTMGYAAQFPNAESSVVWIGPHRVGRLLVNENASELRLIDIALLEAYRGSGIGTELLQKLHARTAGKGVPLRLSVRIGNPALRLYERLGFVATGGDAVYTHMELRWGGIEHSTDQIEAETPAERVPRGLSSGYFRWLVGQIMDAEGADGTRAELEVTGVEMMRSAHPSVELNDSFTVSFAGPETPCLPSAMCAIREKQAELEPEEEALLVFLVPLGPKAGRMQYESIFNRSQWRPTASLASS